MASDTDIKLNNQVVYELFVRNHTSEGTFRAVIKDLERIRSLGTDILWLMPIHSIGKKNRKGSLGSPYSIYDYRSVNHEYGTLDDFSALVKETHAAGMKIIIDVVYNHTSHDTPLLKSHPEFFYQIDGKFCSKVPEWSDVIDLDYATSRKLFEYQTDNLKYWRSLGVDGFRCDVASIVPLDFWREAREKCGGIWLAESVHPSFLIKMRMKGHSGYSDAELHEAFDITYDQDGLEAYEDCVEDNGGALLTYLRFLNKQSASYPQNAIKLRFLENHDQPRAALRFGPEKRLRAWTGFLFFMKGTTLLYAGQEAMATKAPSLFEKDDVQWPVDSECFNKSEFVSLIKKLAKIKRHPIFAEGIFRAPLFADDRCIVATIEKGNEKLVGIFGVLEEDHKVSLGLPDGNYKNWLDNSEVAVKEGKVLCRHGDILIFSTNLKHLSLSKGLTY